MIDDFVDGINLSKEDYRESTEKTTILNWFSVNFAYAILLLIPFFSIATYVSFVNKSYNYLEHIVINSYITGQQFIFYCVMAILDVLLGKEDLMISFALVISMVYRFWTFTQFFDKDKTIKVILRLFLAYLLFVVLVFILMTTGSAIILLLDKN